MNKKELEIIDIGKCKTLVWNYIYKNITWEVFNKVDDSSSTRHNKVRDYRIIAVLESQLNKIESEEENE